MVESHYPVTFPDGIEPVDQAENRSRVARHRAKLSAGGAKRVEVTVPAGDAKLVKDVAGLLRAGGEGAERVRQSLRPLISPAQAKTGAELVAFFRSSPLVGVDLQIERDKTPGRSADFD